MVDYLHYYEIDISFHNQRIFLKIVVDYAQDQYLLTLNQNTVLPHYLQIVLHHKIPYQYNHQII